MSVNQAALAASMNAAVEVVQAAIEAAGTLADASLTELAPVELAVSGALPTFAAAVSALDGDIPTASLAGMVVGLPVPQLVSALQTYTSEVQQLAVALNAQGYLERLGVNLANAPG